MNKSVLDKYNKGPFKGLSKGDGNRMGTCLGKYQGRQTYSVYSSKIYYKPTLIRVHEIFAVFIAF